MCLALPGRVTAIMGDDPMMRIGKVAFSGVITEVNLCFVPDARSATMFWYTPGSPSPHWMKQRRREHLNIFIKSAHQHCYRNHKP